MTTSKRGNGFSIIEHTADIGINIWGTSLEKLFRNAIFGLIDLVAENIPSGKEIKSINITAPDNESLLIDFLNELLYLINVKKWIPNDIKDLKLAGNNLNATITGEKYDSNYPIKTEIKAATYHNIKINNNVDIWETTVFFDV